MEFEELEILRNAEAIADSIWRDVGRWEPFALQVVGKQLARAADSIGANIAEAYGRFHYGEKLQFLYYARGSLYETKYWLNRALERNLFSKDQVSDYAADMSKLARQLNASLSSIRNLRMTSKSGGNNISETNGEYLANPIEHDAVLFSETDLEFIEQ